MRILFVCMGNICRSPTAEGVMRTLAERAGLGERVQLDSAGTGAWHVGSPPDARASAAARARGYTLEGSARQVRSGDVDVAIVDDWTSRLAEEIELGGSILTCYHLIRDQLVLVLPRTHPAAAADQPVDLRALRHEPWLAAPAGEPSRQAVDRLLAAVGVTPPVLSEFEGMSTIVSLVARGIGIAILPGLAVAAADRRITVRDLPHGLDLARDVYAVARTASVRRPSVAVIVTALRAAGPTRHRVA